MNLESTYTLRARSHEHGALGARIRRGRRALCVAQHGLKESFGQAPVSGDRSDFVGQIAAPYSPTRLRNVFAVKILTEYHVPDSIVQIFVCMLQVLQRVDVVEHRRNAALHAARPAHRAAASHRSRSAAGGRRSALGARHTSCSRDQGGHVTFANFAISNLEVNF